MLRSSPDLIHLNVKPLLRNLSVFRGKTLECAGQRNSRLENHCYRIKEYENYWVFTRYGTFKIEHLCLSLSIK